jgi:hypothetical protein
MVFRLIVTYFALETMLTIRLKEPRQRLPVTFPVRRQERARSLQT